jgi:hypothetical protein
MTRIDRRALIASAAALGLSPAAAVRAHTGWHARAPLPWAVQEIYAAVWQDRIVMAGGLRATRGQPLHIAVSHRRWHALFRVLERPAKP